MPAQLTSPGVYVGEVPSRVRTITGVATSVTAFVGRAARGAIDRPVSVTTFADFEREFGGLWNDSALGFSVRDFFLNGGSSAVVVRLFRADSGAGAKPARASLSLGTGANAMTLTAATPGAWANQLRARVDFATRDFDAALGETATSLFNLFVRDGATGAVEEHRNLVISPTDHPRFVTKVLADESRLVTATSLGNERPAATGGTVDPGRTIWDDNASATNTEVVAEGQASDGQRLTSGEFTGPGREAAKTGLYLLEHADLFNLLVIPPYKADATVDSAVVKDADAYCLKRRAVQIIDPLPTWNDVGEVTAVANSGGQLSGALGANSRNAALYFPRVKAPNPLNQNQREEFTASGAIAGVIARTDATRGVWTSPAGLEASLVGVPELSVPLGGAEIGQLNPLGVNCLRSLPGAGCVVWGARTMQGDDRLASEWKYLPVRRTALFLEESLYRGTQWVVFEPNDDSLWAQIRLHVGTFMDNLFRQGAFQGTTPNEAYYVACGTGTTTQADIDLGIINIEVGFAPLRPTEFVVIRLQQSAGPPAA